MWMIEIPPKLRKVLVEVQDKLESVTDVDSGILVAPKRGLQDLERIDLHIRLTRANGVEYVGTSDSYLIRKETLVAYHLEKLKVLFHTSQSEIRESMMFLMAVGTPVDRIQGETGASRATIYRYLSK